MRVNRVKVNGGCHWPNVISHLEKVSETTQCHFSWDQHRRVDCGVFGSLVCPPWKLVMHGEENESVPVPDARQLVDTRGDAALRQFEIGRSPSAS